MIIDAAPFRPEDLLVLLALVLSWAVASAVPFSGIEAMIAENTLSRDK